MPKQHTETYHLRITATRRQLQALDERLLQAGPIDMSRIVSDLVDFECTAEFDMNVLLRHSMQRLRTAEQHAKDAEFTGQAGEVDAAGAPRKSKTEPMSASATTYTCDECGYQADELALVVEHLRVAHGITDAGEVGSVIQRDGRLILRSGDSETEIDLAAWLREHLSGPTADV